MQRLMVRSIVLALVTLLLGTAACGPNPGGKIPVSSPVYAFQAPETDDLKTPSDDDDDDDDDDTTPPDDME